MAYRFKDSADVSGEVQRIVEEQIDGAVAEIDDAAVDPHTTIHQIRKRCKKIRAVLRLARAALTKDQTYGAENARFRDIARDLSPLHDAEALVNTHDALVQDIKNPDIRSECDAIREKLIERRARIADRESNLVERVAAARDRLLEGRTQVAEWARRVRNFKGLEPGFERIYRRGRRAMNNAYRSLSQEDFHEWRKRVKYHWYACRLLREIWPPVMDARRAEARRLSELLGDEHDLSVYRTTLESEPGWFTDPARLRDVLAAVDQRRTNLRRAARPLGMRLYAEKPGRLSSRFAAYWQAWHAEHE